MSERRAGSPASPASNGHVVVTVAEVHRVVREALLRAGCDDDNAEGTASVMSTAERDGCLAHGVFRLPGHLASLASGKANGRAAMAFGWPRRDGATLVFDQASAAMSRGEIQIAARDGRRVPAGVGLDAAGQPTTDPKAILAGAQLPFGGYKGSAIALMVELLAAGLIGQPFSVEAGEQDHRDGGPPRGGVTIVALDPARFGDADGWLAHSESFLARLAALPGVRLPGERRLRERARIAREGVRLPAGLWEKALQASER